MHQSGLHLYVFTLDWRGEEEEEEMEKQEQQGGNPYVTSSPTRVRLAASSRWLTSVA